MATQRRTVDFLLEQVTGAGAVTAKPMFGEYGVYVDGKMIGSVCDDQLFVKPRYRAALTPSRCRMRRHIEGPNRRCLSRPIDGTMLNG